MDLLYRAAKPLCHYILCYVYLNVITLMFEHVTYSGYLLHSSVYNIIYEDTLKNINITNI